jgi:uncharacterized protein
MPAASTAQGPRCVPLSCHEMPSWVLTPAELGLITLAASFANGALGAGGAILFVPLALYVLPAMGTRLDTHQVTALSLVQGLCAFAVGGIAYGRRGQVAYEQVWLSGIPLGIGGLGGGLLSAAAPGQLLVLLFALVVTAATVILLVPPREGRRNRRGAQVAATSLLLGIGAIGGAVGVGAGVLVIPVLLHVLGLPQRTASGTGLVLSACISGPAFVGKAVSGQVPWALVPGVVVAAVAGVIVGSLVQRALAPPVLRIGLAVLTGALALIVWARLLL